MFVPVGFFLPFLWKKYEDWKQVLLFCTFLTVLIEVDQIFTFRTTDIDDLLTNLLGGQSMDDFPGGVSGSFLSVAVLVPLSLGHVTGIRFPDREFSPYAHPEIPSASHALLQSAIQSEAP